MAIVEKRHDMPVQDPKVRAHNFNEVAEGYTYELAIEEAKRCLNCQNKPCVSGCPVSIEIPSFISLVKEGKLLDAYKVINESSSLPAVCGRVCPQENQCEAKCTLGIKFEPVAIGRIERYVADYYIENNKEEIVKPKSNGIKVAIIGAGPSGLTCAGDLAKKGFEVTIFEALHVAGGVLVYGIPEFRLPKTIVSNEVSNLIKLGVEIKTNVVVGKTITVDELFDEGYKAVYIGSGAGLPSFMGIEGETLNGVYSANEFLTRSNLMKAYKDDSSTPIKKDGKVIVVGGGNVAMDAARTALRLGASSVTIVYRRSLVELPARKEEVEHAEEEGVIFKLLNNPLEIIGDEKGNVKKVKCIKMELGEPDERGRRRPVPVEGSEFELEADTVIIAIGTSPNPLLKNTTNNLEVNKRGGIVINEETGLTSKDNVYAGGDAVTGAATVISAMGAGKLAAKSIIESFTK